MTTTHLRWPVQPLVDHGVTGRAIRRAAAITHPTKWRQALDEGLTDTQADRAAIRLGTFPHMIWPDWTAAALTPLDLVWLEQGWRQAWLWNETA